MAADSADNGKTLPAALKIFAVHGESPPENILPPPQPVMGAAVRDW